MESETIADIVADSRQYVANTKIPPEVAETIVCYLDRIEAAWKREKSQSWHHREMEELILRHEKEIAELKKQTGNAAAMREALVLLSKKGHRTPEGGWMFINLKLIQKDGRPYPMEIPPYAEDVINAALSAPARNCDCYKDADSAYIAFCGYDFAAKDISDNAFIDWLFAPAKKKGEGDGSK